MMETIHQLYEVESSPVAHEALRINANFLRINQRETLDAYLKLHFFCERKW